MRIPENRRPWKSRAVAAVFRDGYGNIALEVTSDGVLLRATGLGKVAVRTLGYRTMTRLPAHLCRIVRDALQTGSAVRLALDCDNTPVNFSVVPLIRPDGGDVVEPAHKTDNRPATGMTDLMDILSYTAFPGGIFPRTWTGGNFRHLTGFFPDGHSGRPDFWLSRIHEDDRNRVTREFQRLFTEGKSSVMYRWERADGKLVWFLDNAVLTRNACGLVQSVTGAVLSIDGLKKNEVSAEREKVFLEAVVGNLTDGIAVLDGAGACRYVNAQFTRMTGIGLHECACGSARLRSHRNTLAAFRESVYRALGGLENRWEGMLVFGRRKVLCSLHLRPFRWEDEKFVISTLSVCKDPPPAPRAANRTRKRS